MNIYIYFIFILIALKIIVILNNYYNGENYTISNDDYDDYSDNNNNYKISTNNLRKMYIKSIVQEKYNNIISKLMDNENKGKSHNYFSVVCVPIKNKTEDTCHKYDGYQKWSKMYQKMFRNKRDIINFIPYIIRNRILYKIQMEYPQVNIKKIYKDCCDYYTIY
jgi:hypothetical protein